MVKENEWENAFIVEELNLEACGST